MLWAKYITFFGLSMVKFLFTPFGGPAANLGFWETYFSCIAGAMISAALFYYSSGYFIKRAADKKRRNLEDALRKGDPIPKTPKFTKSNKFIIRIKHRFGMFGIAFFAPLLLSIPVGSVIAAKFYGSEKTAFLMVVFGIVINGLCTTALAFALYG
jgi:hypothetical protein